MKCINASYDIIKVRVSVLKYVYSNSAKCIHYLFKICRARFGNRIRRWPSAKYLKCLLAMSVYSGDSRFFFHNFQILLPNDTYLRSMKHKICLCKTRSKKEGEETIHNYFNLTLSFSKLGNQGSERY